VSHGFSTEWLVEKARARRALQNPQPQRDQELPLGRGDAGKAGGLPKIVVRFIGCRVRPLDPDNFAGSVKDLLDGLRHAGLIPGDEPWKIKLETEQRRVQSLDEEVTQIEIEFPTTG
jgi:hypothetical protein